MASESIDVKQQAEPSNPAARPAAAAPEHTPPAPTPQEDTAQQERRRISRLQATSEMIIAVAVVLTICYIAKLVIVVLLVSTLLAFILTPLVDMMQRIHIPRGVAALIAVLLLLAALYGVVYVSYNRAVDFSQQLPKYSGKIRRVVTHFRQRAETIQKTTESVLPERKEEKNAVTVRQSSNWGDYLTQSVGSVTEFVLMVAFIPFLVYFMLSWQEHVRSSTVMLFRLENRNTAYVTLGLISEMIRSFIVGNVLVGLFIGAASTIVFAILGLPYFYFTGFISGFLSLVPYLGVVIAAVPPLATGIGQIRSTDVIAIVITVLGLHLFALNVLYPKFLGSRLQLNPLAVTLALLFWGWLWGAMGLILAIPITAATKIIFDHIESLRPYGAWLGE
jgi:predicted PurR-regulated permease PerM